MAQTDSKTDNSPRWVADEDETRAILEASLRDQGLSEEAIEREMERIEQEAKNSPPSQFNKAQAEATHKFLSQKDAEFYARRGIKK